MASGIIVAAGKGLRMKEKIRKQYMLLGGLPILSHSLVAFHECNDIQEIVLVIPQEDVDYCRHEILKPLCLSKPVLLVAGGAERQDSVRNGLLHVQCRDIAVIHDAVRPFIHPETISNCIWEAQSVGACIFAIPVVDTIKKINGSHMIVETIPRTYLWQAQTPQAFRYDIILKAHESATHDRFIGTDDASLVERIGFPVKIIEGKRYNIKITTQEDLFFAETILKKQTSQKTKNF